LCVHLSQCPGQSIVCFNVSCFALTCSELTCHNTCHAASCCLTHHATCGCTLHACTFVPTCACLSRPGTLCECLSGHITVCHGGTICPGGTQCLAGTGCGGTVVGCGGTVACGGSLTPVIDPASGGGERLAALKAQLQEQIKAIEQQERIMTQASRPQTVEEAEALEKKLTQQLEELRSHKATLRSQGGQGEQGGQAERGRAGGGR